MSNDKTINDSTLPDINERKLYNPRIDVIKRLFSNKVATVGLFVFLIICMACLFAPFVTKWDYAAINADYVRAKPSAEHILGTDHLGRDMFSRLLYGGRTTLRVAFISTIIATFVGGIVGILSGYFGKRTDFLMSHILDMIAAIPVFLLVIVFEVALGWGKGNFMYALALGAMPQFARLVRASVMSIMGNEYIEAAQALGVSHAGIMSRHVLHNVASPVMVRFTSAITEAILICSILGYIGIGIGPPIPEWGAIAYTGRSYIRMNPRLIIFPCATITLSVISLSLFGDGLRDALSPRE